MALTMLPNGDITTTFLLEQAERERQTAQRLARLDRAIFEDAMKWREMVARRKERRRKSRRGKP